MFIRKEDVQQLLVKEEDVSTEQQRCSFSPSQEGREPGLVKEEIKEEEVSSNISFIPVEVEVEGDEPDDDASQISYILPGCRRIVKIGEDKNKEESPTCSFRQHIKTEADGIDCVRPELDLDSVSSECDTDDSEDWRETSPGESSFDSVENPKAHTSHKKDESLICSGCGRKCSSQSGLTQHYNSCHGGSFTCSFCEKSFQRKETLEVHMAIHTGVKCFSCTFCGKSYTVRASFMAHMKAHTGEKSYNCSQCDKGFYYKTHLSDHMRVHTGEKPFRCSQCGKYFRRISTLKRHMSIHSGEKSFSCSHCDKCFSHKWSLKDHMRVHTEENPFTCSQCGKSYSLRASFMAHMKLHSGEKPFSCSQCDKRFYHKNHLNDHMKVHSHEKPFTCSQCGKCFKWKKSLIEHAKTHTGDESDVSVVIV